MSEKRQDNIYPSQLDKVREITDKLEAGIQTLFESEAFKNYLNTLSKFHDYSLNNTLLIAMQKPDATLVAGYTAWQKNFKRHVKKGEAGIKILAPAPYRKHTEIDRIDPATGKAVLNPDGSPVRDQHEIIVPAFKVVSVFDVSQTEGRELPSIGVDELSGNVRQYEMFFEALKQSCPVPVGFEQISSGAKGYYHTLEQRIALQAGMSQVQTVKTMIHEMAHQKLHSFDRKDPSPDEPKLTRNAKEVEAEAVAYTVSQHYGIETSDYSFAYIAGWSRNRDTPELKASLDRIRKAADELIISIDDKYLSIRKEKEAELTAVAESLAVRLDALAYDYDYYGYVDIIDNRDIAVAQLTHDLMTGQTDTDGLLELFKEMAEDEEYGLRATALITEVRSLQERLEALDLRQEANRKEEATVESSESDRSVHVRESVLDDLSEKQKQVRDHRPDTKTTKHREVAR